MNRRGPFDGVRDVLRFNWPTYLGSAATATALLVTPKPAIRLVGAGLMAGIVSSLAAVHLAYDRTDLYKLDWLPGIGLAPKTLVLHAGIDDVSPILCERLGLDGVVSVDVLAVGPDTEPSILRARNARLAESSDRLDQLKSASFDLAVAFLSLHEIRTAERRVAVLASVKPLLKAEGRLVVVEHMRDAPNLAAFAWGAFHFHPRHAWLRDFAESGFDTEAVAQFTPLIHSYTLVPRTLTK